MVEPQLQCQNRVNGVVGDATGYCDILTHYHGRSSDKHMHTV